MVVKTILTEAVVVMEQIILPPLMVITPSSARGGQDKITVIIGMG